MSSYTKSLRPRARLLRLVPTPKAPAETPELWIGADQAHAVLIDESGGKPLATLPMHEAMAVLRAWWTAQHAEYWRQQWLQKGRQ